jgi:biopolymer transport protein TolR
MAGGIRRAKGQGRRRRWGGGEPMSEINVTPMVDVMLVLLIIFMVTAPLLTAGVEVDLPESSAAPLAGQDEPLSVSVDAEGRVYVQDKEVTLETLPQTLMAIAANKTDTRIFVRGDRSIDYGRVMQVMGTVTGAGFTKVSLVTTLQQTGAAPAARRGS